MTTTEQLDELDARVDAWLWFARLYRVFALFCWVIALLPGSGDWRARVLLVAMGAVAWGLGELARWVRRGDR